MPESPLLTPNSSLLTKKWLITGGCGFIGTSLIKDLVAEGGHFIRVIDNLSVGSREDLARVCQFTESPLSSNSSLLTPNPSLSSNSSPAVDLPLLTPHSSLLTSVELIPGDILDETLAMEATKDMDIIVHLAANTGVGPSVENPRLDCVTNIIGTLNYLEAARHNKVRRFVFASSGAPVGECNPPIHEELPAHPVSPYGASKLAGEGYCSAYYRTFDVETVALRFGNVYGPLSGHKNSVVAKFIRQAMHGETLEIYGDGKQTRDFIYIGDLVRAVRLAANVEGIGGEVFQIATNAETTVGELVELLIPVLQQSGVEAVHINHGSARLGDVMRNFSDTTKAGKLLGWKAETDLVAGLRKTTDWYFEDSK
ncbi:MAG: NAD-dependent epimerase/dehydratase family protein [Thermodesulfobacteriota bacterium]